MLLCAATQYTGPHRAVAAAAQRGAARLSAPRARLAHAQLRLGKIAQTLTLLQLSSCIGPA